MPTVSLFFGLILGIFVYEGHCQCGDRIPVTLKSFQPTIITSPGFYNGSYEANTTCSWIIKTVADTPADMKILLQIDIWQMKCPRDYVRVYIGESSSGLAVFDEFDCKTDINTTKPILITGAVYVEFKSGDFETDPGIGFMMKFLPAHDSSGTGCQRTQKLLAEETEKFITSPRFPDDYPLNNDCSWNITVNGTNSVQLVVYLLDVDKNDNCSYHRLHITTNDSSTILCDRREWDRKQIVGESISITFKTDSKNRRAGFLIGYKSVLVTTTTDVITDATTAQVTIPPQYWDYWWPENKPLTDYYYYEYGFNPNVVVDPYLTTPVVDPFPTFPTAAPVTTTPMIPQMPNTGFWDNWISPLLYYWMF
ncbi:Hypothetical predicted protein [Mytilus galloprovincialis]|uniref:CUB domain-containing protein n=1 Tax=Mytilus galloprovincialis TaxID=29158 RepID=A0A8B6BTK7_MYTGA|nr:Hypothetical predicted protein [Mytilus galloprovincialis]